MSSRHLPKLPAYYDTEREAYERPKKSSIQQLKKKAQHHKTVSSENLIEKSSISKPRLSDNYGDEYISVEESREGDPWLSGFFRRMPTLAVLALLMVPICAGVDAVILYKSDGQEVDSWTFSPAVLLAILSAVANMCLQFARSEGVVISWWRKALRGGTLYDLSRYWESGDSILAAAAPGRSFNLVALATLLAQTVYFDGPLLQRASTIVSIQVTKGANVSALIAEELPYGFSGFAGYGGALAPASAYSATFVMNQTFAQVFTDYTTRTPITTDFSGCNGTCIGSIKAAGLAVNCTAETQVPWSNLPLNDTYNDTAGFTVFSTKFGWLPAPNLLVGGDPASTYPMIVFNLTYTTGRLASGNPPDAEPSVKWIRGTCNGTLVSKQCTMLSASVVYPIALDNNVITLRTTTPIAVDHIQPVGSPSDYFDYHDPDTSTFTTLGGVAFAAQNMFNSNAQQLLDNIQLESSTASQYIDDYGTGEFSYFATQDACAMNWRDPTTDIINALNEIMFRAALVSSNVSKYAFMNLSDADTTSYYESWPVNISSGDTGMPSPQILDMQQTSNITVFKSNYSYLAAALAVMMLGFLVVMPTLYGFWEMGRRPSLNPLEIAKAFNADLLQEQSSNAPAHHLTKEVRERHVRYGEVIDGCHEGHNLGGRSDVSRLEIADPSRVREPRFRAVYI